MAAGDRKQRVREGAELSHILTILILFPIAAGAATSLLPGRGRLVRWFALAAAILFFALTLELAIHYDYTQSGFQFEAIHAWASEHSISYHVGVDGISLWLVVATGFLAPLGVLASWKAVDRHVKTFYSLLLLQQAAITGVFLSLNLFLYYAFWLLSLIVPAILIATAGRKHAASTAIRFSLFTILPSLLLLASIVWLYLHLGTSDFVQTGRILSAHASSLSTSALLLVSAGFLVAFSFKVPVFPTHGWLAGCFQKAPVAVAMTVSGALGIYSILRFYVGLFPAQASQAAPWMMALAVVGVLYGALVALSERDMKRLAAYAAFSGASLSVLGIFCFTVNGVDGAIYQAINQSIIGGALLIFMGFLQERYGTDQIQAYGGLAARMPRLALLFAITSLALIGLPLLSGFVGEFLILSGAFPGHTGWATAATLGFILSAGYMFHLFQRVFLGQESRVITSKSTHRMGFREHGIAWPMVLLMLAMGIVSPFWMRAIDQAAVDLVSSVPAPYHGTFSKGVGR